MLILFLTLMIASEVFCDYGVLIVENEYETQKFCASIADGFSAIGSTSDNAKKFKLVDYSWWDGCYGLKNTSSTNTFRNSVVVLNNENCFFIDKAFRLSELGASGIIAADPNGIPQLTENFPIDNFTITLIAEESLAVIKSMNGQFVQVFIPRDKFYWDFSYVVIWLIAVGSVCIGAIWTQAARARVEKGKAYTEPKDQNDLANDKQEIGSISSLLSNREIRSPSSRVMIWAVAGYIAWIAFLFGYVLLNYYFFKYMVYVNIALFCVIVPVSLYWCFLPFIKNIPLGRYSMRSCCVTLEIRESIWFIICIALTIMWCIFIRKSWIWMLQNLFGMAICIFLLSIWRVGNLKNCTIILGMLFVYDIFMVFITPLFTHDGKSVMEKLVIGAGDADNAPLMVPSVFQCPFISTSPLASCTYGYLILGFGDIIVPGILISFCHDFSVKNKISNVYFITSLIGYGFGLLLTGIFINVMRMMQPALLYLVPCSILPVFIVACVRKEFRCMWYNHPPGYKFFSYAGESNYKDSSLSDKSLTPRLF